MPIKPQTKRTREEEATQMLGHTDVSPKIALCLVMFFLLTLTTLLFTELAVHRSIAWTQLPDKSALSQHLQSPTQYGLTKFLGTGNEQVYPGHERWLYYRPDVDYVTGPGFLAPAQMHQRERNANTKSVVHADPIRAILELQQDLAQRHIQLIVMPVPVKPMIESEMLSSNPKTALQTLQNPSYALFLNQLQANNVLVFDPTSLLVNAKRRENRAQYLRDDTHWTPSAMETTAQNLALYLLLHTNLTKTPAINYQTHAQKVTNVGDIAAMLRLPHNQTLFTPQSVQIHPIQMPDGKPWHPVPGSEVMLLGDSFSNIYSHPDLGWGASAGLAEQLSSALKRPIDKIAINAGGALTVRQQLQRELTTNASRMAKTRVVIYEFAMRELAGGDWKPLSLNSASESDQMPETPMQSRPIVISGTVDEVAMPPKPGESIYKDCLIQIRLTHVTGINTPFADHEAFVYMWGMRQDHLLPAASYHKGQHVTLTLVPWDQVEEQYGSFQASDLDDINQRVTLYWAEETQ